MTRNEITKIAKKNNIEIHDDLRLGKRVSFYVFFTEKNRLFAKESAKNEGNYHLCNEFENLK